MCRTSRIIHLVNTFMIFPMKIGESSLLRHFYITGSSFFILRNPRYYHFYLLSSVLRISHIVLVSFDFSSFPVSCLASFCLGYSGGISLLPFLFYFFGCSFFGFWFSKLEIPSFAVIHWFIHSFIQSITHSLENIPRIDGHPPKTAWKPFMIP